MPARFNPMEYVPRVVAPAAPLTSIEGGHGFGSFPEVRAWAENFPWPRHVGRQPMLLALDGGLFPTMPYTYEEEHSREGSRAVMRTWQAYAGSIEGSTL